MAPGNQEWNGYWADLANAPISTRTTAADTAVPDGGEARISDRRKVPASCPRITRPPSMARAPAPVTSRACMAAPSIRRRGHRARSAGTR